jgi:hypothetical protein
MTRNDILPGRPTLVVPSDLHTPAAQIFARLASVLIDLPDRDDEALWAQLRQRALFFWPDPAREDSLVGIATAMGCDRIHAIRTDVDLWDGLNAHEAQELLQQAKVRASSRASSADLSIVELPAGNPMPLPLDVFGSLAATLEAAAIYAGTPRDFVAMNAIAALSGVTGALVQARLREGWIEPCIIMSACLGSPGSNKTGAQKALEPGLRAIERDLDEQHELALSLWRAETQGQKRPDRTKIPNRELLRIADFTGEALSFALHRNGRFGLLCSVPELAALLPHLGITGDGYSHTGSLRAAFLSGFDGVRHYYARRSAGDEPLLIQNFATPVMAAAQPDIFAQVLNHPVRDGLADRFLVCFPPYRPEALRGGGARIPYEQVVQTLRHVFTGLRRRVTEATAGEPDARLVVAFTPEAESAFVAWSEQMRARAAVMNDAVAGARVKAISSCARIAALGAFLRHVVDGDALEVGLAGFSMARDFMRAALDHRAVAEALAFEPIRERRARALARAICLREAYSFEPADVRRSWRIVSIRSENELRDALVELQCLGWMRSTAIIGRSARDPLPDRIEIDPAVLRAASALLG